MRKFGNPSWKDDIDEVNTNTCDDPCVDGHVGVPAWGHQGSAQHTKLPVNPDALFAIPLVPILVCESKRQFEMYEPPTKHPHIALKQNAAARPPLVGSGKP